MLVLDTCLKKMRGLPPCRRWAFNRSHPQRSLSSLGSLVLVVVLQGSLSCSDSAGAIERTCVPGESKACVGPLQCGGFQVCGPDGTAFLPCNCGEAGVGEGGVGEAGAGDAGPDTKEGGPAPEAGDASPDTTADLPPKTINVGEAKEPPWWATTERAALNAFDAYLETWFATFASESGKLPPSYNTWTFDDVMECPARFDKYLLVAGRDSYREQFGKIFKYYHDEVSAGEYAILDHSFYKTPNDAEHAVELFMYLWAAQEILPQDSKLLGYNRELSDVLRSPALWNPSTRLLRGSWLSTSGVTGAENSADAIINLAYLASPWRAWLATGDSVYRQWTLDYANSWADLAAATPEHTLPFEVDPNTRAVGPLSGGLWYKGGDSSKVANFDYESSGHIVLGRSLHGAGFAQRLADPNSTSLAQAIATSVKVFQDHTYPEPPADGYSDQKGWYRWGIDEMPRLFSGLQATLYSSETEAMLKRYLDTRSKVKGQESKYLDWIDFNYFGNGNPDTVAQAFDGQKAGIESLTDCLKSLCHTNGALPKSGDDLRQYVYEFGSLDYIDGTLWGANARREGAPSTASVRYYRADGTLGLPQDVVALVRKQTAKSLELWLYNHNKESSTVQLAAGHYGQHRFTSVLSGSQTVSLGSNRVFLVLPPQSLAQLTFALERFVNPPQLSPGAPQ